MHQASTFHAYEKQGLAYIPTNCILSSLPERITSVRQMGQEVLTMWKPSWHSFSSHAYGSLDKQCPMLKQVVSSWILLCGFLLLSLRPPSEGHMEKFDLAVDMLMHGC